jgi:NADPH:quinone reductase-like Zn-dependent oxidoreductase
MSDLQNEHRMKAVAQHQYGSPDLLELEEMDKPVINDNQVLIRVHAASVKPKSSRRGVDVAGRVDAVGKDVTQVHGGDEVFDRSIAESEITEELRAVVRGVPVGGRLAPLKPAWTNTDPQDAAVVRTPRTTSGHRFWSVAPNGATPRSKRQ